MHSHDIRIVDHRLLGIDETSKRTNLSRSTIYRLEKSNSFPKRRQISPGRIGWLENEVEEFIATRALGQIGNRRA